MTTTEIKKALYKQKPTADLHKTEEDFKIFTCQIVVDGLFKVVWFKVPIEEADFEEVVPAQLLIRWID